ncbi:MAG: N-acetylmuramoyl-L-alanine amidase [Candidatus Sericytochromatia bacterium]|nr:N-acetylmuramoyl-L-alanine amidase [Candidatus Sericytochromatia bacterium]
MNVGQIAATATCLLVSACAASQRQPALDPWQAPDVLHAGLPPLPPVTEILSPHCDDRRAGRVTAIVLHHTEGASDAAAVARYFQNPVRKTSAHYIVDRDGSLIRCVPDPKRAWHAGVSRFQGVSGVNEFSIGIEICNRGDHIEPYPPAQMSTVVRLVAWLATVYHLPMSRVTRHRDIALPPGRKSDPSDNFDWPGVLVSAQRLLDRRQDTAGP